MSLQKKSQQYRKEDSKRGEKGTEKLQDREKTVNRMTM